MKGLHSLSALNSPLEPLLSSGFKSVPHNTEPSVAFQEDSRGCIPLFKVHLVKDVIQMHDENRTYVCMYI